MVFYPQGLSYVVLLVCNILNFINGELYCWLNCCKNVFSAGMKLIQFVSSLSFVFCWSTLLGRVSRGFVVGWCLVFKALKSC